MEVLVIGKGPFTPVRLTLILEFGEVLSSGLTALGHEGVGALKFRGASTELIDCSCHFLPAFDKSPIQPPSHCEQVKAHF